MTYDCVIIGSGPSGLMAADYLSSKGFKVCIAEKRPSLGWKLLVAGSSGLNISYDDLELSTYFRARKAEIFACLKKFTRDDWLKYLRALGEEPYLGSSKRYFLKNFSAAQLLVSWHQRLKDQKVDFYFDYDLAGFEKDDSCVIHFKNNQDLVGKTCLLALGGASWEKSPPDWPSLFTEKKINFNPFTSANAGYEISASQKFFENAEGKPIKGVRLTTSLGQQTGELMITHYGLEGTPIYRYGCTGLAKFDLKPDLSKEQIITKLLNVRGNPKQKIENGLKLSEGALLLAQEFGNFNNLEAAINSVKELPVELTKARPLSEAISSAGGLSWDELDELELKKIPGIFCAGEMIDWDAPTGGFLIQACISMGYCAAKSIETRLLS